MSKNDMVELNHQDHVYTVNGAVLPSVSEIMRPLTEVYYSGIDPKFMEIARERGIKLHEALDNHITFGTFNQEYKEVIDLFDEFMAKHNYEIYENEWSITNGVYCGTVDLVAVDAFGLYHLIDFKFTNKVNTPLLEVQLAAYDGLLESNDTPVAANHVMWFKKKKTNNGEKWVMEFLPIKPNVGTWEGLLSVHKNKGGGDQSSD